MMTEDRSRFRRPSARTEPSGGQAANAPALRRIQALGVGAALCLTAMTAAADQSATSSKTMFEDLDWTDGNDGAERAVLWTHEDGSNGFLIRADAGFATGYTARQRDYRGIVITGQVGVERPGDVAQPPLEYGSFWVQPAGSEHALTCLTACIFYVEPEGDWAEVEAGAAESDLTSVRISLEDMPWVDAPNTNGAVRLAHVWGDPADPAPSGFLLFFRAGFPGFPHVHTSDYDGVVLQGRPRHWEPGEAGIDALNAGSHLFQAGGAAHDDSCDPGADCISYFRFHGVFDVFPALN